MANALRSLALIAPVAVICAATPAAAQFSNSYLFIKAVKDRDILKAQEILSQPGARIINLKDRDSGDTALHIVVKRKDSPWLAWLLQQGADPNQRDNGGNTPLTLAASLSYADGVALLIAAKADVDLPNNGGETPLIRAVHARDATITATLLKAGADPDRADTMAGRSAREYATQDPRAGQVGRLLADAKKKETRQKMGPVF